MILSVLYMLINLTLQDEEIDAGTPCYLPKVTG